MTIETGGKSPGATLWELPVEYVHGCPAGPDAIKVDEIWCVLVNDAMVMAAWGKDLNATGKVRMLGDGSAVRMLAQL